MPTAPIIEEPPIAGPTSPGGGALDEGDLGAEEAWTVMTTSGDVTRAGAETVEGALSGTTQNPPVLLSQ